MTIALVCHSGEFTDVNWFAIIHEGDVVRGEFFPPAEVDLADEEALLHRYCGPGTIAVQFDGLNDEGLMQLESANGTDDLPASGIANYRCTVCDAIPENLQPPGDDRRWIHCPACEKSRFFEPTRDEG